MNKQKKELMKRLEAMSEQERADYHRRVDETDRQWREDCRNFPELFTFFYDSLTDINERKMGYSSLSKAARDEIRKKHENGEYPQRLHHFVAMELALKESRL